MKDIYSDICGEIIFTKKDCVCWETKKCLVCVHEKYCRGVKAFYLKEMVKERLKKEREQE